MTQKKIKKVWVNGCFDIIHLGHIRLLEYAKSEGDFLWVGIDSDERIKKSKGLNRPINNESARKELLLSIKYVDKVSVFGTDEELLELNKKCDLMVIGEEYRNKEKIKPPNLEIKYFERIEGHSSTRIIESMKYIEKTAKK